MNYPRLSWLIPSADWVCPDGVALEDLQHLASQWLSSDCAASNNCAGTDMDNSGRVDINDFAQFARQWLKGR